MHAIRKSLPSAFILVLIAAACAITLGVTVLAGPAVGALAAIVAGLGAAVAIERPLKGLAAVARTIAKGDRYAILSKVPSGPLSDIARALDEMRLAATEADALVVAERRREAEERLHMASRNFFTRRFRGAIDEVTETFRDGSAWIDKTAADLDERNRSMQDKVARVSDAARGAAEDVAAIAVSAQGILASLERSSGDIRASRKAGQCATSDLATADETMPALGGAASRIDEFVGLIQGIARQTSLVALNASIEAARAGAMGQGFTVVADEVKTLAAQTAKATEDIAAQVDDIQQAVERTGSALRQVHDSVGEIHSADAKLREAMEQQTQELDAIACRATMVASEVAGALPDLGAIVERVDHAGATVLGTAEAMAEKAKGLVTQVDRYFADLDTGAIKVGILHSLSGTMTASERPLQDLLVMMIEQVNETGGLLGRPLEAAILDPRSNPMAYAEGARTLLSEDKVSVIFGCWSSASRKNVIPVLESLNGLLFYPSQYEGEEQSRHVFYTGATPEQQAIPGVDYLRRLGKRRFFLLGSDSVYSRTTNRILKSYLRSCGIAGEAVKEAYASFGQSDWEETVEGIARFGRNGDASVVSTVSGDANVYFYRELAAQGVTATSIPVMTLSIGDSELPAIAGPAVTGHLACWSYLNALHTPENVAFVEAWRKFCGRPLAMTDDPMEATWIGFNLWLEAVRKAGTTAVDEVRDAVSGLRIKAPSGYEVAMDPQNHHLHKPAIVGRMTREGRISPVWQSPGLIDPAPHSPWFSYGSRDNGFDAEGAMDAEFARAS